VTLVTWARTSLLALKRRADFVQAVVLLTLLGNKTASIVPWGISNLQLAHPTAMRVSPGAILPQVGNLDAACVIRADFPLRTPPSPAAIAFPVHFKTSMERKDASPVLREPFRLTPVK